MASWGGIKSAGAGAAIVVTSVVVGTAVIQPRLTNDGSSPGGGDVAHAWVNTTGQTCTRSSSQITFAEAEANGWLCDAFSDAYSAASAGDTVRVKAGDYAPQGVGGTKSPPVHLIGEDGAFITTVRTSGCNTSTLNGLSLSGGVIVDNIDVGGAEPFVYLGGVGSTWQNSTLLESSDSNTCPGARGSSTGSTPEPILILTEEDDPIEDASLINITVEPQHHCTPSVGTCAAGDVYHLEAVRIDGNIDGVLLDSMTFEDGTEYSTAHVFVTTLILPVKPRNVTIRNSVFGVTGGGHPNFDGGNFTDCVNWVFAYNTFAQDVINSCTSGSTGVLYVGNAGPRTSFTSCGVFTYEHNVWQDSADAACDATDTWVEGDRFSINALGLDANYRVEAGSPLIDAGETPGASDYCTGALGSVDIDGDARPAGSVCDAGADERE